jgi:hypothetical protein
MNTRRKGPAPRKGQAMIAELMTKPLLRKRWKTIASLFVVLCLLTDFFPYHGPPQFRYTGSNPSFAVWNFGWPLATAIYDSRNGFHIGPIAYLILPLQCVLMAAGIVVIEVMRWLFGGIEISDWPQAQGAQFVRSAFPWPSIFFAVNFFAAISFLTICVLTVFEAAFPLDRLESMVMAVPALAFAWGEWLLYFRQVQSLELPMGRLCGAGGGLILLALIASAAEAASTGDSPGILFWLVFGGGGLLIAAYGFVCCWVRTRNHNLRQLGGFPVLPTPQPGSR